MVIKSQHLLWIAGSETLLYGWLFHRGAVHFLPKQMYELSLNLIFNKLYNVKAEEIQELDLSHCMIFLSNIVSIFTIMGKPSIWSYQQKQATKVLRFYLLSGQAGCQTFNIDHKFWKTPHNDRSVRKNQTESKFSSYQNNIRFHSPWPV